MAWSVGERKSDTKKGMTNKTVPLRTSGARADNEPAEEQKMEQSGGGRGRDLSGGMEILEVDFLLSIVENMDGEDKNDVTMRRLNFNELLRREQLNKIDSKTLKVYAKDEDGLYGKGIQCEAMKELSTRTNRRGRPGI